MYKVGSSRWSRFLVGVATFAVASITALSLSGCGGSSTTTTTPTVAAPGAPTALTVTGGENVATLQWSPPVASATTGDPATFEIYRSTTSTTNAADLVNPTNFVKSIDAVAGQTTPYAYTDVGLPGQNTTYYYVVAAKNAGGETPSAVASDSVTGPPTPQTYGNNFSAALIFADDIGIGNLALSGTSTWAAGIADVNAIDLNTGLRPTLAERDALLALTPPVSTLPYLTVTSRIDPTYYEQKTINTWQGEWAAGKSTPQEVNAKWGDNLVSASLSAGAKIRIEMVLTKDVTTPMTVYPMALLAGSGINELQGTTGVATTTTTAFVFATNARLSIHKLDAGGNPILPAVDDQALFSTVPDGLNKLSAEIPVSGNFTYGYVWDPATSGSTAGKYRVTFKLDPTSANGVGNPPNNTFMTTSTNGTLAVPAGTGFSEVYIDIDVK
jgi:hypothetical protein